MILIDSLMLEKPVPHVSVGSRCNLIQQKYDSDLSRFRCAASLPYKTFLSSSSFHSVYICVYCSSPTCAYLTLWSQPRRVEGPARFTCWLTNNCAMDTTVLSDPFKHEEASGWKRLTLNKHILNSNILSSEALCQHIWWAAHGRFYLI